jgi:hypothetical protein
VAFVFKCIWHGGWKPPPLFCGYTILQTAVSFNLQLFFSAFLGDLCGFAVNLSKESALRNPYSTTTR